MAIWSSRAGPALISRPERSLIRGRQQVRPTRAPLADLDFVLLDLLQERPRDADGLHDALATRSATRKAARGSGRRLLPGWPRVRFCNFADPDADSHGAVTMTGSLSRLSIFELIREVEVDGAPRLTLAESGWEVVHNPQFRGRVVAAERAAEQWGISVSVLLGLVVLAALGMSEIFSWLS